MEQWKTNPKSKTGVHWLPLHPKSFSLSTKTMASSRILLCMFMLLVITNLQSEAAMDRTPSVNDLGSLYISLWGKHMNLDE